MAELVEEEPVPQIISIISSIVHRLAQHNDKVVELQPTPSATQNKRNSAFHGLTKPSISVQSYMERIFRYANCSMSCYVVAYIYLDRFMQRNCTTVLLNSFNVHRLLITTVLASVKFMDDIYYNNAYFAKVGGISLMEMNYLEVDFLFGVGFELNVTPAVFSSYCSILQNEKYLESPPAPEKFHYFLKDDQESSSCQHNTQLAV